MRNIFGRKILWCVSVYVLFFMIFACQEEKNSPATSPVSGGRLKEFYRIGTGSSKDYRAYKDTESFLLNIPLEGHYRIFYTTDPGTFELVFRVATSSLIRARLQPGNAVHDVSLQKGQIENVPSNITQVLEVFEDYPFEVDPTFGTRTLIKNGTEFLPTPTPAPTSTPKPTPAATATPDPTSTAAPTPTSSTTSYNGFRIIITIGDSITYGQRSMVGGYPPMLESQLQSNGYNVRVINNGIPGARARETDANFVSLANGANIALIMIGTNDVINLYDCQSPDYCAVSSHIRSMVNKARQMGITPLVSTVPPINTTSSYDWANSRIPELNARISSEAGTIIVDNYNAILSHGGNGLFSDALHLNDQGYGVVAREWYNALVSNSFVE